MKILEKLSDVSAPSLFLSYLLRSPVSSTAVLFFPATSSLGGDILAWPPLVISRCLSYDDLRLDPAEGVIDRRGASAIRGGHCLGGDILEGPPLLNDEAAAAAAALDGDADTLDDEADDEADDVLCDFLNLVIGTLLSSGSSAEILCLILVPSASVLTAQYTYDRSRLRRVRVPEMGRIGVPG